MLHKTNEQMSAMLLTTVNITLCLSPVGPKGYCGSGDILYFSYYQQIP